MTTALGQAALGAWVRNTGRSWWQAGLRDGRVINEWETVPGFRALTLLAPARGALSRWEEVDKRELRALRLLTPIGLVGNLETPEPYKLFQFKQGGISIGVGAAGARWCSAHIIGKIINVDGDCELMVYEYAERRLRGPLEDNVLDLRYGGIGPLGLDNLGLRL